MSNTSTLFRGLRDAKVTNKGIPLREGIYEVRVKKAIHFETRTNGWAYIVEFLIEKSNYESVKAEAIAAFAQAGQPVDLKELDKLLPNRAGTTASWYQALKDPVIGFGALKGFAASILNVDPDDPEFIESVEGFMAATLDPPQGSGVLNGSLIPVETVMVKTKEKKDFTRHVWGPIIS